jgi:hypothetical protein
MSNALGLTPGASYPQPGGLGVQVDGVTVASGQRILNLLRTLSLPAYTIVEDGAGNRNQITTSFDGLTVLASIPGIDGKAITSTTLLTTTGGDRVEVELVVVRCVSAVAIAAPPTANIRTVATGDIFGSQILTGLTAAGKFYVFPVGGTQVFVGTTASAIFEITAGATGTSQGLEVDLIGRVF